MNTDMLYRILKKISTRKEIFDVAYERGLGSGMQIEKWLLIEMAALLKNYNIVSEAEHKYDRPYSRRYEHCDLWWQDDEEVWMEVKTIVLSKDLQRGNLHNIKKDIEKKKRIKQGKFYHLTAVFPVEDVKSWKSYLEEINLKILKSWEFNINKGKILWCLFS